MALRPLLTFETLAERLDVSVDWLRKHLGKLCTVHGLPRGLPLPGIVRWDPDAVDSWQRHMRAICGAAAGEMPIDVLIEAAEQRRAADDEAARIANLSETETAAEAILAERSRAIAKQPLRRRPWSALKVARELGVSALWLRRNYGSLAARLSFPRPLPDHGFRHPCWDRVAIDRWRTETPALATTNLPSLLNVAPHDDEPEWFGTADDPWTKTTRQRQQHRRRPRQ